MQTTQSNLSNAILEGDFVITWKTKTGAVSVWCRNFDKISALFRKFLYMRIKAELWVFPTDGGRPIKLGGAK